MSMNLVEQGYFSAESFFSFIPTENGLKSKAPSQDSTFVRINSITGEEEVFELNQEEYPLITVYDYLNNYYCLKYMNINNMIDLVASPEDEPETPYSYIKQVTICDTPGTGYYLASLNQEGKVVRQYYEIGENGFLQIYNSKILGILPKILVEKYLTSPFTNSLIESSSFSLSKIDLLISTTDFDSAGLPLPDPNLEFVILTSGEEEGLDINKKRTFIDNVSIILPGDMTKKKRINN